eukprot:5878529-Pleurochrysis_carterae.AAC.1
MRRSQRDKQRRRRTHARAGGEGLIPRACGSHQRESEVHLRPRGCGALTAGGLRIVDGVERRVHRPEDV